MRYYVGQTDSGVACFEMLDSFGGFLFKIGKCSLDLDSFAVHKFQMSGHLVLIIWNQRGTKI